MLTSRVALAALLLIAPPRERASQSRPDFSGTWRAGAPVSTPLPAPGRPGQASAGKSTLVVSQDGKRVTLTGGAVAETFALDGSETTSYIRVSGAPFAVTTRARWEGTHLMLTTRIPFRWGERTVTREVFLDDQGGLVLRETTTGGSSPHTYTQRYRKQGAIM